MQRDQEHSITNSDRAGITFILFFALFFFLIPCAVYFARFNIYIRSFFYFLAGSAALALSILCKIGFDEIAITLDRKNNLCRFGTYEKSSYWVRHKPLDKLKGATVRKRRKRQKVFGPMGAPVELMVTSYRLFLQFESEVNKDFEEIGWDVWGHQQEQLNLKSIADQVNYFLNNSRQNSLTVKTNLHGRSVLLPVLIALVFFVLIFIHR